MKKLLFLLGALILAGIIMMLRSCSSTTPSRQDINLSENEFQGEAAFAIQSVLAMNKSVRTFSRFWQSHGDIYQAAVRMLQNNPMKTPHVKRIFRKEASKQLIMVELEESGQHSVIVCVWSVNGQYSITDITLLSEVTRE